MSVTKGYLREIFNHDGEQFVWIKSPDGTQPIGTIVNTSPMAKGKPVHKHIRLRGMLFTVEEIEKIYEI